VRAMRENRLGPFRLYAARDIIACLSEQATNVREVQTRDGSFVIFELPPSAPMWRTANDAR
jgi:hypothetical protein